MANAEVVIWDGIEFRKVSSKEAEDLIAKDMAQDAHRVCGWTIKARKDFTGYKTRELRAEEPPTPVTVIIEAGAGDSDTEKRESDSAGDAVAWEDYKDQYKAATGKKRASKEAVQAWMSEEGIV